MSRDTATWVVTAETDPKAWCFKWAGNLVVVSKTDPEELRTRRQQQHKKRANAVGQQSVRVPPPVSASLPSGSAKPSHEDPLQASDPWKAFQSAQSKTNTASASSTKPPTHVVRTHDERVDNIMFRLDALEARCVGG